MISIEVKEKMGAYLMEKYGEPFVVNHIDFNQSSATPNVIYSSDVWPEEQPEVVFRCTLNRDTGEFTDRYPDADLAYRAKDEVLDEFEQKTLIKIAGIYDIGFGVPFERQIGLGDSLDETFSKNPGKVSLSLSVFVEAGSVDGENVVEGMRIFIDEYVRVRGYNYLTLRVWFLPSESLEKYNEDIDNSGYDYAPPEDMCSAIFKVVLKVSQIDSTRLADHLDTFRR